MTAGKGFFSRYLYLAEFIEGCVNHAHLGALLWEIAAWQPSSTRENHPFFHRSLVHNLCVL